MNTNEPKLRDYDRLMHRLAQLLAWTTHQYNPHLPDDSHNTLQLSEKLETSTAIHQSTRPYHIKIDPHSFDLTFEDSGSTFEAFETLNYGSFQEKPFSDYVDEYRRVLGKYVDQPPAKDFKLHYDLPEGFLGLTENLPDSAGYSLLANEWMNTRNNASDFLSDASFLMKTDKIEVSLIAIWPHHFDTGGYFPFKANKQRAIGIGWAVPDQVEDDFYFYIYGYCKDSKVDFTNRPSLGDSGAKWVLHPDGWEGAILPYSALKGKDYGTKKQMVVDTFYKTTIPFFESALS